MRWRSVSLTVEPELAEAVADVLGRITKSGAAVSAGPLPDASAPLTVQAFYPDDNDAKRTEQAILEAVWHLSQVRPLPEPAFQVLDEEDWAEAWKAHYHPLPIGDRLVIIPAWERIDPGKRIPVFLDPGMAFGTGAHPTTRLCLLAIEQRLQPGAVVVDLGCGSGILSVAAARLGALRVLACDIDPVAVTATQRSARANDVDDRVEAYLGSLPETLARLESIGLRADILVANILAAVVTRLLGTGLAQVLAEDGLLVASGILADQAEDVIRAAEASGLKLERADADGDWRALRLTKKSAAPPRGRRY